MSLALYLSRVRSSYLLGVTSVEGPLARSATVRSASLGAYRLLGVGARSRPFAQAAQKTWKETSGPLSGATNQPWDFAAWPT